ncbi:receptor-transporting protein 4-like [Latimeria chalumnae]|uniref:receptor-transporting protein 4-like n=1 Tax=Latimeria chalumnae TaxID=7897 RepID=UPI00313BE961
MSYANWRRLFNEKIGELRRRDTWTIVFDDSIEPDVLGANVKQYIRGSFAKFRCSKCRNLWGSARVPILFHMKLETPQRWGTVKVRFFKQECRKCTSAEYEAPQVSEENIKVVLDKLLTKIRIKCYGEKSGEKPTFSVIEGNLEGPHESSHCEACQLGVCNKGETKGASKHNF